MNTPLENLCSVAANPYPSDAVKERLARLVHTVDDWSPLLELVMVNRIGALLYWHHQQGHLTLPKASEVQLASWYIRNKKVATLRDEWLTKLSEKFNAAGIQHAYLKGTALCHIAYPSSYIRSMDDIDILIDQSRNDEVHQILMSLGVTAKKPETAKELACHQWPIATVWYEGVKFDLEIHTRVLSRRIGGYGVMKQFSDKLVDFKVGQQTRYALSHEEFLITQLHRFKHLTEIFRLIDISDIAGYLEQYAMSMDWDYVYLHHSWIRQSLMAIDCVTPLSHQVKKAASIDNTLQHRRFDLANDPYGGLPVNRYLLAKGLAPAVPLPKRILNTVAPSVWWITLVYGASGGLIDRVVSYLWRHPISVATQLYNAARYK